MSFGKSGGSQVTTQELTPEQRQQIAAQTKFFTESIAPAYERIVGSAGNLYESGAPGVTKAAQNLAGTAGQAQETLGETGESALRTGITGLQNLYSPDYVNRQLAAAMTPAQQQYQQNLAGMNAAFGGSGNLGSSRAALAQTQLAGQTQAAQQAAAAQVLSDIENRRASAASQLSQLGQGGIGQALGAAGQRVSAAMTPQQFFNQYASAMFGTPSASYNPDFRGTIGSTVNTSGSQFGMGGSYGSSPFRIG